MTAFPSLFCLDANFFVQAWNKYYSPKFCPAYWEIINKFGKQGIIFIPVQVRDEIFKIDDDLKKWLKHYENRNYWIWEIWKIYYQTFI